MKRFLKILGITVGSLLGLVIVVMGMTVGVLCKVVFTPEKLTPVVDKVAGNFIGCEYNIDEVNLTIFKTFPNAGLSVKGLYVINPMEGAQSDTVLGVPELVIGIDVKQYLDSGKLSVETISAEDVMLNAYINAEGLSNWDVLTLPEDTTEEDSSATVLPFNVDVKSLTLTTNQLSFRDIKDSLDLQGLGLNLQASATADSTLSSLQANLEQLLIDWNGLQLSVAGTAVMEEAIHMNLHAKTNDWGIQHVLQTIPEQYAQLMPREVEADGVLRLEADIVGQYDSITMPIVDAHLTLTDGSGHYDMKTLPYHFNSISGDIVAHVDLNDKTQTNAIINKVRARTKGTAAELSGKVTDILKVGNEIGLGNPLCDIQLDMDVDLKDAEYWIQDKQTTNTVRGAMVGTINLQARLDDITNVDINKMAIQGKANIKNLDVVYQDSTKAQAESLGLAITAPKKGIKDKNILSGNCNLTADKLYVDYKGTTAQLSQGTASAGVEIDTKDTTHIPTLTASFDLSDLVANMDTIHAELQAPKGTATLTSSRRNKTAPKMRIMLEANQLQANMGKEMDVTTRHFKIEANARYNAKADNVLLQWNPRLNVDLNQAQVNLSSLSVPVKVKQMQFEYNNKYCHIDTSRIELGKSDFSLAGQVINVGDWLRHKKELSANLRFISDHTDVDELLALVNELSGDEGTDEEVKEEAAENTSADESEPFMVPNDVDLTLTTIIRSADAFGQHLTNLGGRVYVLNGVAVLEEIGFICEAAKLQLTGIYKTPRRNHIYVGMDYHMLDIDLEQLVSMVPQLDTLVPMLSSLRGKAEFHIAAETYMNSRYELKPSTLRGACSIEGKDLVLLDSETFSTISKLLLFSKKTENLVDSISAQITLYKDKVTVYPFCLSIDNYMVAVGGNHYLDMTFNYHASVLSPIYLGVDVGGNLDNLDIKLAKCRYAKDFKPLFHRDVDEKAAEIRQIVSNSLKKNVTIK